MPEFLSPGVYVEEVDAGPKPIEGVSTSTAGAVGVTTFGPTSGKPVLVTSFAEFLRKFGPPVPEPEGALFNKWALNPQDGGRYWQFALSIKGFFDNGGQRIFVKRVFSSTATAAGADFGQGLVSEIETSADAAARTLKLRHLVGIGRGSTVSVFAAGDPPALVGTFKVLAYDAAARTVRLDKALGKAVKAGRDFVEIHARKMPPPPANRTLTIQARALGGWGNDLQARVRPMVGTTASLLADPATGGNAFKTLAVASKLTWVIEVDDADGFADNQTVEIKGTNYTIADFDSSTRTFVVQGVPPADVLTSDEAVGKKLQIRTNTGATTTTVKTALAAAGGTIELVDVTKLAKGDVIEVGGGEHTLVEDPTVGTAPAGTVKVSPPFPGPVAAGATVKKRSANIVSAGTRRKMTLETAGGIGSGNLIFFVPTGKQFEILAAPAGGPLRFAPAIPLGKDWEGQAIQKGTEVAKVQTPLNATADTVEVTDVTALAATNAVNIRGTRYVIVTVDSPGKKITVTPPFVAGKLPRANDQVFKLGPEIAVTSTAADWSLEVQDASGLTATESVLINGEEIVIGGINGNVLSLAVHLDSGNPWPAGTAVRRLRSAKTADPAVFNVSGASQLYPGAIVELDNGSKKETATIDSINGDAVKLSKALNGPYLEGHKLRVIELQIQARYVVGGQVVQEESFTNLRLVNDKSPSYFITALANASALIEVADPLGSGFPTDPSVLAELPTAGSGGWALLAGGFDKLENLSVDDFVGVDGGSSKRTGLAALEDIDEISICLVPGIWAPTVHAALIEHCEILMKDRFAILDPQDGLSLDGIRTVREALDSKYAAIYYPWIEVRDSFAKRNVDVAPSGHMAGIYARVDVERGVHKAPANEVIRGITKIAQDVSKREQDLLNPKGINALRFFPGRGNRVWGARTISSDSSWKYINVRRLFLFVEESIDEGTQFVVFEPNSDPTWARVRQTIENFLLTVWRSGALEGTKPDQAFFVKCDRTTMSQDDIDNGRLICVIGIAPVKPAEFVIFRIQQKTLESNAS